ncbi:hypothetical protein NM208_g12000 [Fusarium decemcellulare]|uniref:Uncharacterized protein n=1 Tax=Fusarium decemcellulare TaxID=57161 RepID=A0ACC1RQE0_9HYPO|nr:hypothetical protein NM208_g12000 [Fusarium decemcellulare]
MQARQPILADNWQEVKWQHYAVSKAALGDWNELTIDNEHVFRFGLKDKISIFDPKKNLPIEKMVNTDHEYSVLVEGVRTHLLGGLHPYAPLGLVGSQPGQDDAYYVKVKAEHTAALFEPYAIAFENASLSRFSGDVYVSLHYLRDMALDKLAWNTMEVLDLELAVRNKERQKDVEVGKLKAQLPDEQKSPPKYESARKALVEALNSYEDSLLPKPATLHKVDPIAPGFDFIHASRTGTDRTKVPQDPQAMFNIENIDITGNSEALQRCSETLHSFVCTSKNKKKLPEAQCNRAGECPYLNEAIKGVFPFRNNAGRLFFGFCVRPGRKYKYYHSFMRVFWNEYWGNEEQRKQRTASKSRGWRTRYDSSPLSRPLVIWMLPGAQNRFCNTFQNPPLSANATKADEKPPEMNFEPTLVKEADDETIIGETDKVVDEEIIVNEDEEVVAIKGKPKEPDIPGYKTRSARDVFERLIGEINRKERLKNNTIPNPRDKLELASKDWKPRGNYVLLSEDPFRLYQTYIHKDCVNDYMQDFKINKGGVKEEEANEAVQQNANQQAAAAGQQNGDNQLAGLATDTNPYKPHRSFPLAFGENFSAEDQTYIDLKTTISTSYWPDNSQGVVAHQPGDNDEDEDEEVFDNEEDAIAAEAKKANEKATKKSKKAATKPESNTLDMDLIEDGDKKEEDVMAATEGKSMTRRVHVNPINANKIIQAAGSRKSQKSQKEVMGFSASYFAAQVLKWSWHKDKKGKLKDRQMSNGLYIAEWLHMSAYSWGGIQQGSDRAAQKSSQTKENLVFGTSESNSCMTRYEKAWQQLFKDEKLFLDTEMELNKRNPTKESGAQRGVQHQGRALHSRRHRC